MVSSNPPEFNHKDDSDASLAGNLALLKDLAQSFRRLKGRDDLDAKGLRTIWHQGRLRTEMLSWENQEGKITKQELSLFGLIVEYAQGKPLRTGQVPLEDAQTAGGRPTSSLVKLDSALSPRTLTYASHMLKHVPDRDYYTQHLLMHVNQALNDLGPADGHTMVSDLSSFASRGPPGREEETHTNITEPVLRARPKSRLPAYALLAAAAALLLGAGLLLRRVLL